MIDGHKTMAALAPADQAIKALQYFLTRSRDDPRFAWFTLGTETLALCTEAYAALTEQDLATVRKRFLPPRTEDPKTGIVSGEGVRPKIQLSEDEVEVLEELANHHDTMAETLTFAAATAQMQQGHGLYINAERHNNWGDECRALAARGKER